MKFVITSPFQAHESFRSSPHTGIDIRMEEGTPLSAIQDGIIKIMDYGDANAGKTIFLEMEDGTTAIYGHLSEFIVNSGDKVQAGDLIGYSGNTGFSTGEHLHFAIKEGGTFVDPSNYIDGVDQVQSGLLQWFLDRGAIDNFNAIDLTDALMSFGVDAIMWVGILFLLFFNKYTRNFTIASAVLMIIFGG